MIIRAELKCKQTGCEADPCAVDKVIELPSPRFRLFSRALLADYDFISAITNAQQFIKIQESYGSFDSFIWSYVDGKPILNQFQTETDIPARTALSDQISKDLKELGFKFVGSTIIYAYMQAIGIVNDHVKGCHLYANK